MVYWSASSPLRQVKLIPESAVTSRKNAGPVSRGGGASSDTAVGRPPEPQPATVSAARSAASSRPKAGFTRGSPGRDNRGPAGHRGSGRRAGYSGFAHE